MSKARDNLPQRLLDYVVLQDYSLYSHIDQAIWRYIMKISLPFFMKNAHESYISGLEMIGIPLDRIPKVDEMDKKLDAYKWGAVTVKGFIPPIIFMEFLSRRVLPIAVDMRTLEHVTYTPAPDIIHEAAGHAPIIANTDYADYLCAYGEVAKKAIQSKHDSELYKIIKKMSDMKEDPNVSKVELKKIEVELENKSSESHWTSEANELARMNWWTIEYGLIGDLNNPKIYGAGLLSSVSESLDCLDKKVKKIPISIECIHQDYNITEPQPQLYVANNFKDLIKILDDYSKTMGFKTGGKDGIKKAVQSENVTTALYDSGLQISGIIKNYISDNNGEITYLNYDKNVQLSYGDNEIPNHGIDYHSEGYGAAIGKLSECEKPIHQLNKNQLNSLGIKNNSQVSLEFIGGLTITGSIKKILEHEGKPIIITMENTNVKIMGNHLFKPDWGTYDLACGGEIISVFGGPADWNKYYKKSLKSKKEIYQSSNLTTKNFELNELYNQVQQLKKNHSPSEKYLPILNELYNNYPGDWLLCMEIYEIIIGDSAIEKEINQLLNHINGFKKDEKLKDTIDRGLQIIA